MTATRSAGSLPVPPSVVRPLLFPRLLAACHQALRDVRPARSTVLGYAWGGRSARSEGIAGCFMNTAVSVCDSDTPASFSVDGELVVESWLEDLSHLDVPFDEVVLCVPWSGEVDALVVFEDLTRRLPLRLAGHAANELPWPALTPKAPITFSARLDVHGLDLFVGYDNGVVNDITAKNLCDRWREWVAAAHVTPKDDHGGSRGGPEEAGREPVDPAR
jgi:hypothetical protein